MFLILQVTNFQEILTPIHRNVSDMKIAISVDIGSGSLLVRHDLGNRVCQ